MKKLLQILILLSCLIRLNVALGESLAENKPRALKPRTFKTRTLKIGAVLPLSGPLTYYGTEIKNGILLAQEQSLMPVQLFFEDAPILGEQILSAFNHLTNINKIDAIAGNFSNQAMLLMANGINRLQIPTFHTAAIDEQILASSDWIFSTNVRVADEAHKIAERLFFEKKIKRVAVLAVETSFGLGYRKAFIAKFEELGGVIVADELHQVGELDFRTQILKLKSKNPEAYFLATFGNYLGNAVKQIKNLQISELLFSVYETEDQSVLESAGAKALEGIEYFVSYQENLEFAASYFKRFNKTPTTFAMNAYDATQLLIQAYQHCKFDRVCVKDQLYKTKNYQGVSGRFDIHKDGGSRKQFILHGFHNGKFQRKSSR